MISSSAVSRWPAISIARTNVARAGNPGRRRLGAELPLGYDVLPLQGKQSMASTWIAIKTPEVPD